MPAMRAQASAVYIGVITIIASSGPVIVSVPSSKLIQTLLHCRMSTSFLLCMPICHTFSKWREREREINRETSET